MRVGIADGQRLLIQRRYSLGAPAFSSDCSRPSRFAGTLSALAFRERLETLYGGDAKLNLRRRGDDTIVAVLDLPLEARQSDD